MKITGLKTFFAAVVVTASLSACHCSANDNTSRPSVNDENGNNIGNSEIEKNFTPGSDCDPANDMYDGISGNLYKTEAGKGGGPVKEQDEQEKEGHEE